jgi:putative Mg2+ transporter-C (MgtC) family protein
LDDFFNNLNVVPPFVVLGRILSATAAGFFIGIERERHHQSAGLRTHMVLALGAALVMVLSMYLPFSFAGKGTMGDPGRLAAQVISGIGFLGAGAIFRYGFSIKGLTTAASIWTTSGIGLTFGAGFYFLGITGTVVLLIILYVFDKIEDFLIEQKNIRLITVRFHSDRLKAKSIIDVIKKFKLDIRQPSIIENVEENTTQVVINCNIDEDFSIRELFESIKSLGNIINIKIE